MSREAQVHHFERVAPDDPAVRLVSLHQVVRDRITGTSQRFLQFLGHGLLSGSLTQKFKQVHVILSLLEYVLAYDDAQLRMPYEPVGYLECVSYCANVLILQHLF